MYPDISPGLAFFLGWIPGVGAIYNGQYAKGLVHAVAFSPDGRFLVTGSQDGGARLWDTTRAAGPPRLLKHGRDIDAVVDQVRREIASACLAKADERNETA